jgi:hypothetical protein
MMGRQEDSHMSYEWKPMTAREAGTGKNLGGPTTQLACRLYRLDGWMWPRLRLAAFEVNGQVQVSAWAKDEDKPGWQRSPIPDALLEEAAVLKKEANQKLNG